LIYELIPLSSHEISTYILYKNPALAFCDHFPKPHPLTRSRAMPEKDIPEYMKEMMGYTDEDVKGLPRTCKTDLKALILAFQCKLLYALRSNCRGNNQKKKGIGDG
jgi:hypothetical protein